MDCTAQPSSDDSHSQWHPLLAPSFGSPASFRHHSSIHFPGANLCATFFVLFNPNVFITVATCLHIIRTHLMWSTVCVYEENDVSIVYKRHTINAIYLLKELTSWVLWLKILEFVPQMLKHRCSCNYGSVLLRLLLLFKTDQVGTFVCDPHPPDTRPHTPSPTPHGKS